MTKKDFILIAKVLKTSKKVFSETPNKTELAEKMRKTAIATIEVIEQAFSFELSQNNPKFDKERFIKACEI